MKNLGRILRLHRFSLAGLLLFVSLLGLDMTQPVEFFASAAAQPAGLNSPSNTHVVAVSDSRIDVYWQDNSANETGFLPSVGVAAAAPSAGEPLRRPDVLKTDVLKTYGRLPLPFETNLGQTDSEVKFLARGAGYTVFLTPSEAVLVLRSPQTSDQTPAPVVARLDRRARGQRERETRPQRAATVVRLGLVGANPDPGVVGLEPLSGKANYFTGNDPQKWRTGIPTYAKVRYRDVYPGVDVVYYGAQQQLEYDFVVAPGADPTRIRLAVTGAEALSVDAAGDLVLQTASGALRLHKPLIYQVRDGVRQEIAGGYVLLGKDRVGFRVAAYDTGRPVVIDPVLSYSTYLGGGSSDIGYGIAVDSAGNAYVTGTTFSSDFPTVNALQPTRHGYYDAFVAKLNPAGSALVYSTYLGGRSQDYGYGIAVDSAGNAYVTGTTFSSDFPTVNALRPGLSGSADAFVAKLNAAGSALVYSTFLGGSDFVFLTEFGLAYAYDSGSAIAVDSAGNAYVTGTTPAFDFPTVNALQPTLAGFANAFVAKLNPAGSALVYSTFLGGSSGSCDEYGFCYPASDDGLGIAVDSTGNAYVTGTTPSPDFPTVNALQPTLHGYYDAFVAKLNAAGSALVYSTYLGGSDYDSGYGIAVDSAGNAYVSGTTSSSDFPTASPLQPALGGYQDAFAAKLDPAGSALVYSTYLGGNGGSQGFGIAVDSAGNAYVTGATTSSDFPTANPLQPALGGYQDAFVAKLDPAGSALVYSTYLGGSYHFCDEYGFCYGDYGRGIAVDGAGSAYVTGATFASDFPTVNALQPTLRGASNAFVAKISPTTTTTQPPVASFTSGCGGLTCSFDGTISSDPDGTIVSYSWNFGDGTTGSGPIVSHTYAAAGTYTVELTVTDNTGATGIQSKSVTLIPALSSLNLNPAGVTAGSTSSGIVTLSAAAPAGGAVVALASNNTAVATVPTSVTVAAGATSATFTVSTNSLTACASSVATISATYGGVTRSADLTVTPATDTVAIQQADYIANRHQLRVAATSTGSTAALQVYVTSTAELIGTLKHYDGNRYSGQFTWPVNPQNITVRSSLCGSATKAVTSK